MAALLIGSSTIVALNKRPPSVGSNKKCVDRVESFINSREMAEEVDLKVPYVVLSIVQQAFL
jgi:hypothetical protein